MTLKCKALVTLKSEGHRMCREHVVKPSDHLGKKGNVKKPKEQLWTAVLYSTGEKTNLEMD